MLLNYLSLFIFILFSIPIVYKDLKEKKIPDFFSFTGIITLLITRIIFFKDTFFLFLLAGVIGFLFFLIINLATKGKLGMGDVKYSGFIGLFLGIEGYFLAIIFTCVIALLVAFVLIKLGKINLKTKIPFGPFMFVGAFGGWVYGLV